MHQTTVSKPLVPLQYRRHTAIMGELHICPAAPVNSRQVTIKTPRGEYLIQVSWPLCWGPDGRPKTPVKDGDIPIIYQVDGNAFFYTATDIVRRFESLSGELAIVVAIGYPYFDSVYCWPRRGADLTPPSDKDGADGDTLADGFGRNWMIPASGGAKDFLELIEGRIMPFVEQIFFPHVPLTRSPKTLFGHSYGGLFALYSLFTRTELFDAYIVASPSIWYNDCSIVHKQEKEFLNKAVKEARAKTSQDNNAQAEGRAGSRAGKPRLLLTWGSLEQYPERRPSESDEEFERRRDAALKWRMEDNARDMGQRLQSSGKVQQVRTHGFLGEDHGGAAVCGLQRGITWLFE